MVIFSPEVLHQHQIALNPAFASRIWDTAFVRRNGKSPHLSPLNRADDLCPWSKQMVSIMRRRQLKWKETSNSVGNGPKTRRAVCSPLDDTWMSSPYSGRIHPCPWRKSR